MWEPDKTDEVMSGSVQEKRKHNERYNKDLQRSLEDRSSPKRELRNLRMSPVITVYTHCWRSRWRALLGRKRKVIPENDDGNNAIFLHFYLHALLLSQDLDGAKPLDVDDTVSENTDNTAKHPEEQQPSESQAEEEVRTEAFRLIRENNRLKWR